MKVTHKFKINNKEEYIECTNHFEEIGYRKFLPFHVSLFSFPIYIYLNDLKEIYLYHDDDDDDVKTTDWTIYKRKKKLNGRL